MVPLRAALARLMEVGGVRRSWLVMPGNSARRRPCFSWDVRARMATPAASFPVERSHIFLGGGGGRRAALGGTQREYPQPVPHGHMH